MKTMKRTRQSEFLKLFPNTPLDENGVIEILEFCPMEEFGVKIPDCHKTKTCEMCRKDFWLEEVPATNIGKVNGSTEITRQSEFLKLFPNAPLDKSCLLDTLCPMQLGEKRAKCHKEHTCEMCRRDFWLNEFNTFVPETLDWCRYHYVPKNPKYITCGDFGRKDGMDGSCHWCREMTPYQWHMCADESWIQGLLRPISKAKFKTREEAAAFIEKYKQRNPLGK